jgi:predicted DNA-binding protein
MANAKEIKIPIVITANGAKAVAGLQAFKTQANKIDGMFSRWGTTQISSVGGMLFGFLGIASAINGIRELYAESKKLSELAGTYAPEVVRAQAETQISQIQKDLEVAKAITPVETRRANIATEDTQKTGTSKENLISSIGLQIDLAFSAAQYRFISALDLLSGNMGDFAAHTQMASQRTEEMGGLAAMSQSAINTAAQFLQNFTRDEGQSNVLRLIDAFTSTQKNIELPEKPNIESIKNIELPEKPNIESIKVIELPEKPNIESIKNIELPEKPNIESIKNIELPEKPNIESIKNIELPEKPNIESIKNIEPNTVNDSLFVMQLMKENAAKMEALTTSMPTQKTENVLLSHRENNNPLEFAQNFTGKNESLGVSEIINANTKNMEDFYSHSKIATDTNNEQNNMAALSKIAIGGATGYEQNFARDDGSLAVLRLIEANTKGGR